MTKKSLNKSQAKSDIPATGVEQSTNSTKEETSQRHTLKALNDIYLIQEDPIAYEVDKASGLTQEVVSALKDSRLILPDIGEYFASKYPCIGTVISKGSKCKFDIPIGAKVSYARLGVQRFKWEGKDLCAVREADLHGIEE